MGNWDPIIARVEELVLTTGSCTLAFEVFEKVVNGTVQTSAQANSKAQEIVDDSDVMDEYEIDWVSLRVKFRGPWEAEDFVAPEV